MTLSPRFPQPQTRVRSSLSLPARVDYLEPLQNYVRGLCQIHGCVEKDTAMVVLATEEAVSNVIQHSYASDKGCVFRS